MMKPYIFASLALLGGLSACSSGAVDSQGNLTLIPPTTAGVLSFAVGTARAYAGPSLAPFVGLNIVAAYRQANGLTATLYNVPTIVGPANFVVQEPTGGLSDSLGNAYAPGDLDVGSNRLTNATFDYSSTTGASTILSGYGLCQCSSNQTTVSGTQTLFTPYAQPLLAPLVPAAGGPPAFPTTTNGNYPTAFVGYSLGYTELAVEPFDGEYTLQLAFPPNFGSAVKAVAKLVDVNNPLPIFPQPTFSPDGTGGGTIGLNIPPGVVDTIVEIEENAPANLTLLPPGNNLSTQTQICGIGTLTPPYYFSIDTKGSGTQTVILPDNLGPMLNGVALPTLCENAGYVISAVGFNYDAYGAAYPMSRIQHPVIAGLNGEADLTQSQPLAGIYTTVHPAGYRHPVATHAHPLGHIR